MWIFLIYLDILFLYINYKLFIFLIYFKSPNNPFFFPIELYISKISSSLYFNNFNIFVTKSLFLLLTWTSLIKLTNAFLNNLIYCCFSLVINSSIWFNFCCNELFSSFKSSILLFNFLFNFLIFLTSSESFLFILFNNLIFFSFSSSSSSLSSSSDSSSSSSSSSEISSDSSSESSSSFFIIFFLPPFSIIVFFFGDNNFLFILLIFFQFV